MGPPDSAVAIPALQERRRVEEVAALVPAGRRPDLEVEVAAARVAGIADVADPLAGADYLPLAEQRRLAQVHVDEVEAGGAAVDHDVVAGRALVAGVLDPPPARGVE